MVNKSSKHKNSKKWKSKIRITIHPSKQALCGTTTINAMLSSLVSSSLRKTPRLARVSSIRAPRAAMAPSLRANNEFTPRAASIQIKARYSSDCPFAVDAPDGVHDLQNIVSLLLNFQYRQYVMFTTIILNTHLHFSPKPGRIVCMDKTNHWRCFHYRRRRLNYRDAPCRFWWNILCGR